MEKQKEKDEKWFQVVNTCNFGKDYPDEYFLNVHRLTRDEADGIAEILNKRSGDNSMRIWLVVDQDYELSPGFEP